MINPKQQTGLTRNTVDKYYTKPELTSKCISNFVKLINPHEDDCIIEPSAGDGAFISHIKSTTKNHLFYDLYPEHPEIIKQDYLILDCNDFNKVYRKNHVIGNPPFGRQSTLAIKFIKKSAKYCDSISFILPKSFKKDSMKKHFPLCFHMILEEDVPKNSFMVDGREYDVPCVFQIWEKRDVERVVPKPLVPTKFTFVKRDQKPDISFRRVGVYAGNVDKHYSDKSIQSHYFIKFDDGVFTDELFDKLQKINYKKSDATVGPKSISKQELIKEFIVVID